MSAKKLYNMNLKNQSNYGSFWDCGRNSGIQISTRVCMLSACWSSISLTIINVRNGFVARPSRDSSRGCRICTHSRKLDILLQCIKSLKTFSKSVSRCPIVAPWSLHQRIRTCPLWNTEKATGSDVPACGATCSQ